jgi:hypothetical protein
MILAAIDRTAPVNGQVSRPSAGNAHYLVISSAGA